MHTIEQNNNFVQYGGEVLFIFQKCRLKNRLWDVVSCAAMDYIRYSVFDYYTRTS